VIKYEYIEPKREPEQALKFLSEFLFPLIQDFWKETGSAYFKSEVWDLPIIEFAQFWMENKLIVITAEENSIPLGFLLGARVRPLLYQAQVLQVEIWYGKTEEVRQGLFKYLESVFKFLQVDRMLVPDFGKGIPEVLNFNKYVRNDGLFVRQ
jgi:hypothetical protein